MFEVFESFASTTAQDGTSDAILGLALILGTKRRHSCVVVPVYPLAHFWGWESSGVQISDLGNPVQPLLFRYPVAHSCRLLANYSELQVRPTE